MNTRVQKMVEISESMCSGALSSLSDVAGHTGDPRMSVTCSTTSWTA